MCGPLSEREKQMEAMSPWGDTVYAESCWACSNLFADGDEVVVVDAAAPKVVHATDRCRDALVRHPLAG